MSIRLRRTRWIPLAVAAMLAFSATAATAGPPRAPDGNGPAAPPATPADPEVKPPGVRPEHRQRLLGQGWQRSGDRMWTTIGDATGFHILVAEAKTGYTWRTAASLSAQGVETDRWIGNACVTASGRRAVVVYAPRTFTNRADLFDRGGLTAVVDLVSGAVRKLPVRTTLAYFNPGCGVGESAVLTQGGDDLGRTRVMTVAAKSGRLGRKMEVPGQLTGAVPTRAGIVAADAGALVRLDGDGVRHVVAPASGVPFHLAPTSDGGVVFLEKAGDQSRVRRLAKVPARAQRPARGQKPVTPAVTTLATGRLGEVGIARTATGKIIITGSPATVATLPTGVSRLNVPPDAAASTQGESIVLQTRQRTSGFDTTRAKPSDGAAQIADGFEAPQPVDIQARSVPTGQRLNFTVDPGDTLTPRATDDPNRVCAVPRNDPNIQVYQPKPKQVEWAVDMAVKGHLTIQRPANWKNNGLTVGYSPQAIIPPLELKNTNGGQVPAQVMLGIIGQESNLWQASRHIIPGQTGNPLVGNYYGNDIYNATEADDWDIRWDKADCGYGVTQMTDGMRLAGHTRPGEEPLSKLMQRAIGTDYAANVAAGLRLLQDKWNQMQDHNMKVNDNDPSKIENWFFAVWAYNSGYHLPGEADTAGAYGLGWAQNPANPNYDPARHNFGLNPHDYAVPQGWPYAEKVLGFATNPPSVLESPDTYVPMFRPAWWNSDILRSDAPPPPEQFCTSDNNCEWGASYVPNYPGNGDPSTDVRGEPAGPCAHKNGQYYDLKCWWHSSSAWKVNCDVTCGNEFIRYDYPEYAAEPADGNSYPAACGTSGLPSGALVVDDVPADLPVPSVPAGCAKPARAGTFDMEFAVDAAGRESSKMDLHQNGGGFGGHFFWGHSRLSGAEGGKLKITGTWRFSSAQDRWGRLLVHLPDHHAHTQQAAYQIDTGSGSFTHTRYINQKRRANNWVSLGVYKFTGVPRIRLSTQTDDGTGEDDVAYDAAAFQPLPGKPKHVVAVLGDSYTSGEGAGDYYTESNIAHGTSSWNACRRSKNAWGRKIVLPGTTEALGAKADRWDTDVELGFVACSGARTYNVWDDAFGGSQQDHREGQFNEQKQVRSGALTADTTLVMMTVGGNDGAAFAMAMQDCAGLTDCSMDDNFLPKYKGKADSMVSNAETVLRDIAARAPNAQIVLMGYPELLSRTVKCAGSWYYDMTEVKALAELVNYANGKQRAMADRLLAGGVRVQFADPVSAFVGHGGCDDPEWIHKIVIGPNGDGDFHSGDPAAQACLWEILGGACLSRESFHPKSSGTGSPGYAGVMRQRLDQIGYTGS